VVLRLSVKHYSSVSQADVLGWTSAIDCFLIRSAFCSSFDALPSVHWSEMPAQRNSANESSLGAVFDLIDVNPAIN
jgi:hypothetical protein